MLLAKKKVVEYEARRANAREASDAVTRAERLLSWAADMIESGRP
jgi:hypothetical protein